jgi:hypothetical protein
MTVANEAKQTEKEAKAEALKARTAEIEAEEKEANKDRSGKGTRVMISMSRGRNPVKVTYEAFDESLKDTLPTTLSEFMEITKVQDEPTIMEYLIDGFNSSQYTQASDPVAEYVDASWPDDIKKGFRLVVRNYAANANVSIEDAVALIKPAYLASQAKK